MFNQELISKATLERALKYPLKFDPFVPPFNAPHLTSNLLSGRFKDLECIHHPSAPCSSTVQSLHSSKMVLSLDQTHQDQALHLVRLHQKRLYAKGVYHVAAVGLNNQTGGLRHSDVVRFNHS